LPAAAAIAGCTSCFPAARVTQGMKIAGLPEAPHAIDPSYGTAR
jgi:hypothetical protein